MKMITIGRRKYALKRNLRLFGALSIAGAVALVGLSGPSFAAEPIKIGVIAPGETINGKAIFQGAKLAVDQLNENGGISGRTVQIVKVNDHASASDAVRGFQRATQSEHVVAVTGAFSSEVALSLEPWAARLKTPFIVTGAASTKITKKIHDNYHQFKYVFHDTINSYQIGEVVCDFAKDSLVKRLHYKTAAIMSEDAAWTQPLDRAYEKCLPASGLKVVGKNNFSTKTQDFSPIFNKLMRSDPDVIITAMAHVGIKPTLQWHSNQIPVLMAGESAQAGATTFWDKTRGATEGVITWQAGVKGAAITKKSIPFQKAYRKAFGTSPAYDAYSSYDSIYIIKNAIERSDSTSADKLVKALEKTDYTGTWGKIRFQGRKARFTHGLVYGDSGFTGIMLQWQKGKQVAIWPQSAATGNIILPKFVKKK